METSVQELIRIFTEMSKKEGDSGFVGRSALSVIKNADSLNKNKGEIIYAFQEGTENYNLDSQDTIDAEQYYDDKYEPNSVN